jgi:hypothetical protein
MTEPDEDYESSEPARSPGNGNGTAAAAAAATGLSPGNGTGSPRIAGLVDLPEHVVQPSGPNVPALMRRRTGPVANFGQNRALPFDDEDDNRMSANSQGDEFANLRLQGSEEDLLRDVIANSNIAGIRETNPELTPNDLAQMRAVVMPGVNAQMQRMQRNDQMQRTRQLNAILRNCNPNQMRRLVRLIDSVEQANHETALRRRLQQLDQILQRPQRISGSANVTRSYSREFRRFGCRSPQARRALHAFFSELRDQVAGRLHDRTDRRNTRRRQPQQPQQPQQQPQQPPQSKGGKRQTKKRASKRTKTVKRR